jgi:hypothetical protein
MSPPERLGASRAVFMAAATAVFCMSVYANARGDLPSESPPDFEVHTETFD